jgi:hypothetical protein
MKRNPSTRTTSCKTHKCQHLAPRGPTDIAHRSLFQILQQQVPQLSVDVLEQELKALGGDGEGAKRFGATRGSE